MSGRTDEEITQELIRRAAESDRAEMAKLSDYASKHADIGKWIGRSAVDWAIAEIEHLRAPLASDPQTVQNGAVTHE